MAIDELIEKRIDLIKVLEAKREKKLYEESCEQYGEGMRKGRKNQGLIKVPDYIPVIGPGGGYIPFPGKKLGNKE